MSSVEATSTCFDRFLSGLRNSDLAKAMYEVNNLFKQEWNSSQLGGNVTLMMNSIKYCQAVNVTGALCIG